MNDFDIIIVGGGYSGIISAIELKKKGYSVCVLEALDRVGKKILSTGNGRCNLSNTSIKTDNYNTDFVKDIIEENVNVVKEYYSKYGLLTIQEDGRIYPHSESANSVLNVLLELLSRYKVEIVTNAKVTKIEKINDAFVTSCENRKFMSTYLIFATGSNATIGINSHSLLAQLGHKTTPFAQTLVPLKQTQILGANGVRAHVEARLFIDNKYVTKEYGEVLFKDGFISGILAFRLSSFISRALVKNKNSKSFIVLDFVPDMNEKDLKDYLSRTTLKSPLMGVMHKALAANFVQSKDLAHDVKNLKMDIEGLGQISNSQVTSGGLDCGQFDPKTLESKIVRNLYATGEVLDVDGECGGYNLHWALASALRTVKSIVGKSNVNKG